LHWSALNDRTARINRTDPGTSLLCCTVSLGWLPRRSERVVLAVRTRWGRAGVSHREPPTRVTADHPAPQIRLDSLEQRAKAAAASGGRVAAFVVTAVSLERPRKVVSLLRELLNQRRRRAWRLRRR
jgi:hypothetical protein